ncbi:MAG TPA: ABC transporter ATP-binding protein [Bryobacteraceae bacterium]|jgi:ABC-2 type transport system ATP-binding protein|nr:ABC transporter ATP-binding protein [Bryobacteraceae bacterium]
MLEARSLTKCYSTVPAIENVNFSIHPGEVLGYLGPNGSGKSTTVKIITGLLEPTSGKVLYRGCDIRDDLAGYKRLVGYVPEEANLYPFLTGLEYIELVGRLRALPGRLIAKRADELLKLFALHPHRHTLMSAYSKGMRQRILLITAILHNPEIVIFDEPLSGLDVTSALVFRKLVSLLSREGKFIFYCSHVLEVVEKVCSHVIVLQAGKPLAYGTVEDLKSFQSMPSLEAAFSLLVQETDATETAENILDTVLTA